MSEDILQDVDPKLVQHVINRVIPFRRILAEAGTIY